jgi:nucleoside-diphosphate-sugar epimerase
VGREIMKVLLTGSTGRVGSHAVTFLAAEGHEVITTDEAESSREGHVQADLRDLDAMRRAVRGCEAVIHNGAISWDIEGQDSRVLDVNLRGTWTLLLAARDEGIKRFVFVSSINALGLPSPRAPIRDSDHPEPRTPYQVSKHAAEEVIRCLGAAAEMTTICLRPTWVTRPSDYAAWSGPEADSWVGEGSFSLWSHVAVEDVALAMHLALTVSLTGHHALLLAADDVASWKPASTLLASYAPDVVLEEGWLTDPRRSLVDASLARDVLGWRPRHSWATRCPAETVVA